LKEREDFSQGYERSRYSENIPLLSLLVKGLKIEILGEFACGKLVI